MSAEVYDIEAYQGDTLEFNVVARDSARNYINLSGYNARGYVRSCYGDTGVLLDLQPQVDSSYISGLITVSVSGDLISNIPITQGVYDIEVYANNGYCFKILKGDFNIYPEVTH